MPITKARIIAFHQELGYGNQTGQVDFFGVWLITPEEFGLVINSTEVTILILALFLLSTA
jgi:hypothetical protein